MSRFTFPTGTIGGHNAVRDLVDRVRWMRRFHGKHVDPVVTLSDTFMNTRFGGRLGGDALQEYSRVRPNVDGVRKIRFPFSRRVQSAK